MMKRRAGASARVETFDEGAYSDWRANELADQFEADFDGRILEGRDVVDFGTGEGDLAFHVAKYRPKSILGLEIDPEGVRIATERAAKLELPVRPEFRVSGASRVELPDASCDAILCFDVLEHVMDPRGIVKEWRRVLRPGGRLLIWWSPWFNPYGPHIESLVPIPWSHAIFSERVLIETCARVYEMADYEPRVWDFDEEGRRKPNKWRAMDALPEVNRLTIEGFERLLDEVGIAIVRRKIKGFSGRLARLSRPLTKIPRVQEFFTSAVIYDLSV